MSVQAPEQFGRRLDAVFGALDRIGQPSRQPGTSTQWSVARQQVYRYVSCVNMSCVTPALPRQSLRSCPATLRAGKGEADSSEGEEEEEAAQQPSPLLNSLLDAEDGNVQVDHQGNIVQPSLAFCQALDNEQEYDDVDAVAGTSLRSFADPADSKPNRFTEVYNDSAPWSVSHEREHPLDCCLKCTFSGTFVGIFPENVPTAKVWYQGCAGGYCRSWMTMCLINV